MKFKPKAFFLFSLCFMLFTAIGTISHEYGHAIAARAFGHSTVVHYGSINYYPEAYLEDPNYLNIVALQEQYAGLEKKDWPEEARAELKENNRQLHQQYSRAWQNGQLWIRAGGPIQTMFTGLIGLFFLLYRRSQLQTKGFGRADWLAVFLSLFWLRQVFNLVNSVGRELIAPNGTWFGGDEYILSKAFGIWTGTIPLITGLMGTLISAIVIFVFVPLNLRLTFILGGLIGSSLGFVLWMELLGPWLLP